MTWQRLVKKKQNKLQFRDGGSRIESKRNETKQNTFQLSLRPTSRVLNSKPWVRSIWPGHKNVPSAKWPGWVAELVTVSFTSSFSLHFLCCATRFCLLAYAFISLLRYHWHSRWKEGDNCHAPMQIGDKCTWLSYKLILIMPLISQAHIPGRQISPLTIYVLSYWIQFHRSIETNCIANIFRCKSFECFKGANWIYVLNKANGVNGRLRKCEYTFNIIFYDTSFITCKNSMGKSKDLGNELTKKRIKLNTSFTQYIGKNQRSLDTNLEVRYQR